MERSLMKLTHKNKFVLYFESVEFRTFFQNGRIIYIIEPVITLSISFKITLIRLSLFLLLSERSQNANFQKRLLEFEKFQSYRFQQFNFSQRIIFHVIEYNLTSYFQCQMIKNEIQSLVEKSSVGSQIKQFFFRSFIDQED